MREIILYAIAAISSVVVLGYTVHMFIGGLVKPETESRVITIACIVGALMINLIAWNVIRRQRK